MSIETNIARIADALEVIANHIGSGSVTAAFRAKAEAGQGDGSVNTVNPAADAAAPAVTSTKRKKKEAEPAAPAAAETVAAPAAVVPPVAAPAAADSAPAITIESLRAVGTKVLASGKGDKMRAVLSLHGVEKLSLLPAAKYPEVLAALNDILAAA